jgi:uncharacterized protein (DUF608 family)
MIKPNKGRTKTAVDVKLHKIGVLYKHLLNGNSVKVGQLTYRMSEDEQIGFVCWDGEGNEQEYILSAHYPTIKELDAMVDGLGTEWFNICASNVLTDMNKRGR